MFNFIFVSFFLCNYRYFVISALPNLKFLDSSKVSPFERQNADELSTVEENSFLKFFDSKNIFKKFTKPKNVLYSPLPDSFRAAGEHKGKMFLYNRNRSLISYDGRLLFLFLLSIFGFSVTLMKGVPF